jgi:hypothetical protein
MSTRQAVLPTATKSSHPIQLLSRQGFAPLNRLNATLVHLLETDANKRLTAWLNPLNATLTENTGWVLRRSAFLLPAV